METSTLLVTGSIRGSGFLREADRFRCRGTSADRGGRILAQAYANLLLVGKLGLPCIIFFSSLGSKHVTAAPNDSHTQPQFEPGRTSVSQLDRTANGFLVRAGKQPTYYEVFPGNLQLGRGEEVICRTPRGIEIAEVLSELSGQETFAQEAKWIRRTREEDRFLLKKLEEMSLPASEACQRYLEEQNASDVLLEVEPLLDGRTLYFHFLGEPSPAVEEVIDRLADEYQSTVAKSRFAELVEKGCGPGCGTKEKSGCGTSQGCAVCAIAGGCTKK